MIGKLYHFPARYLKAFSELPAPFVYYEPREGGDQVYFGVGTVLSVYEDTEDVGHSYAEIGDYVQLSTPVDFYSGPNDETWEAAKTMRNSVRRISAEQFEGIVAVGGVQGAFHSEDAPGGSSTEESFKNELAGLPGPGKRAPHVLRRVRRILEAFERPGAITNQVKKVRGADCQLCGVQGFLKRDGRRYCEVHHLFHLAGDPPAECLEPEYLVVLCATCHRRMHYADVGLPKRIQGGWLIMVDGQEVKFETST